MKKDFFINNRKKFSQKLKDNSIVVLSSGCTFRASADEDFDYEVDKNFYYLTGINQAEVNFVMTKKDGKVEEYLFVEKNDPIKVKWVGAKLEIEEAKAISGIDNILHSNEFGSKILEFRKSGFNTLYLNKETSNGYYYDHNYEFSKSIEKKLKTIEVIDCYLLIVQLRYVKEKEEVEKIKESIAITKVGVEKLMSESRSGIYEYQLENYFDFVIKDNGQRKTSFKTIAASGVNGTILHYVKNDTILKDGDLILFDLGTETEFYISDISRTFPVNGKFTKRQREVYEEVLNVNKKCIEFLKPGCTRAEYNEYAKKLLTEACYRLGLITKDEDIIKYYFHSIGHPIGLDTHDPMDYADCIKEGSLFTVEPGLYIPEENIGIRIEDDVLITKDGCINLSKDIIKEVDEIEDFFTKHNKYVK